MRLGLPQSSGPRDSPEVLGCWETKDETKIIKVREGRKTVNLITPFEPRILECLKLPLGFSIVRDNKSFVLKTVQ